MFCPGERIGLLMKEIYIEKITQLINTLDENQLKYVYTFIKKLFGSR